MGLYRIDPHGKIYLEGEFYQCPNGLAFSPDERILYLALTEADEVVVMDVAQDGSTSNVRSFARVPYPDGIAIDPVSYTHLDVYKRQSHILFENVHKSINYAIADLFNGQSIGLGGIQHRKTRKNGMGVKRDLGIHRLAGYHCPGIGFRTSRGQC